MPSCELCGKETNLIKAEVEGSILNVCSGCGRYGKKIGRVNVPNQKKKNFKLKKVVQEEIEEILVDNFPELIRKAREKRKLKRKEFAQLLNERESLVQKWEAGTLKPKINVAKRLGRTLNLNLVKKLEDKKIKFSKNNSGEATLGDFIKIRKRK